MKRDYPFATVNNSGNNYNNNNDNNNDPSNIIAFD